MPVGIGSFAAAFDEISRAVNPAERLRPDRAMSSAVDVRDPIDAASVDRFPKSAGHLP